jgi:transcriptional regulator with XRE-family HTH domain
MCSMERDWVRLAREIAAERERAGMTQLQLAAAVGVGRSAIQKLERGHEYSRIQPVHRAVARVLGWTEASIELILDGGAPEAAAAKQEETPSGPDLDADLSDLPLRVLHAIGAGRLVDSAVINLDPDDPEATATLVLKRGARADASPEQLREDLRKWSELQRAARRIYGDDQSS